MALREKLKRAFKSSSPSSSKAASPTATPPLPQQPATPDYTRWPSNVYRPDEPMPRPKYRAPVKKEHKEKLESFNFSGSWRRRSRQSVQSPMGSRLPSRRGSRVSRQSFSGQSGAGIGRESMEARRRSIVNGNASRNNSISATNIQSSTDRRRMRHSLRVAHAKQLGRVEAENGLEDDAHVAKGGLPRLEDESEEPTPAINVKPATPLEVPGQQHTPSPASPTSHKPLREPASYFPFTTATLQPASTAAAGHTLLRTTSHESGYSQDIFSDGDYDDYYCYDDEAFPSPSATGPRKADSGPSGKLLRGDLITAYAQVVTDDELANAMARSRMSVGAVRRTSSGVFGFGLAAIRG